MASIFGNEDDEDEDKLDEENSIPDEKTDGLVGTKRLY